MLILLKICYKVKELNSNDRNFDILDRCTVYVTFAILICSVKCLLHFIMYGMYDQKLITFGGLTTFQCIYSEAVEFSNLQART